MLTWMEDQLERLREEQRPREERPSLQLPIPGPPPGWVPELADDPDDEPSRVIIIDL